MEITKEYLELTVNNLLRITTKDNYYIGKVVSYSRTNDVISSITLVNDITICKIQVNDILDIEIFEEA